MDVLNKDPTDSTTKLLKKSKTIKIMQTPCKHRFHVCCLQDWMNIKLECPFCRQAIPVID